MTMTNDRESAEPGHQGESRGSAVPPNPSEPSEAPANPRVVVGLGNPGAQYANTRHNVGFLVVEELARRRRAELSLEECRSKIFKDRRAEPEIWMVAPQTYMNRSGFAVRCLQERFSLDATDFLIVYDEVHLGLGTLRLRTQGSPGGHRGMESVAENLGTDKVARLRLGVGTEDALDGADLVDFVLGELTDDEQEAVRSMTLRAADACEVWCQGGAEPAMQKFNGRA